MSSTEKILRKHELDAIITQAVSPELMDIQYLQELQVCFPIQSCFGFNLSIVLNFSKLSLFPSLAANGH